MQCVRTCVPPRRAPQKRLIRSVIDQGLPYVRLGAYVYTQWFLPRCQQLQRLSNIHFEVSRCTSTEMCIMTWVMDWSRLYSTNYACLPPCKPLLRPLHYLVYFSSVPVVELYSYQCLCLYIPVSVDITHLCGIELIFLRYGGGGQKS